MPHIVPPKLREPLGCLTGCQIAGTFIVSGTQSAELLERLFLADATSGEKTSLTDPQGADYLAVRGSRIRGLAGRPHRRVHSGCFDRRDSVPALPVRRQCPGSTRFPREEQDLLSTCSQRIQNQLALNGSKRGRSVYTSLCRRSIPGKDPATASVMS
jgi:hypothetical protein